MKDFQVTLMCDTKEYKPVSCIVTLDESESKKLGVHEFTKKVRQKGIAKICQKRYWTGADLKKFGYTTVKVRVYDKEKIAKENAERYEKIKEEKYASGEWKRPKGTK